MQGQYSRIRKAEDNNKHRNIRTTDTMHGGGNPALHPERARHHVSASTEQMRRNGRQIARGAQHDEAADKGIEGRRRRDVDGGQHGADDGARQRRVERVREPWMDPPRPAAEGCCVVACQCVEHPARRDVVPDAGAEIGEEDQDHQAAGAGARGGCLGVDFGERVQVGRAEYRVEVVDAVG